MIEEWKVIESFPDYAVSDSGKVKRIVADCQGRNLNRIVKPWMPNSGYLQVRLYRDGSPSSLLVHRLVCVAFCGEPPTETHHAAHADGSRTNNKANNLRWKTPSENNMERHGHGTMLTGDKHPSKYMPEYVLRGSRHGNAKLDEAAVINIRADTRTCAAIAKQYNVDLSLISKIKRRTYWRHVQ